MKSRPVLYKAAMIKAQLREVDPKTQTRRIMNDTGLYAIDPYIHGEEVAKRELKYLATQCPYGQPGDQLWAKETWNTSNQWASMKPSEIPYGVPIFYAADYSPEGYDNCKPWRSPLFMMEWMSRVRSEIVSIRVERLQEISEADAIAEGVERVGTFREEFDASICRVCGGTGLYTAHGFHGASFDTDCTNCTTHKERYRNLWNSINLPPSPIYVEKKIVSYVSFPWCLEDFHEAYGEKAALMYRGKPIAVTPNPYVWVIEFKRIES